MNLTKTERDDWLRILHAWLPHKDFRDALDRLKAAQRDYLLTNPRAGFYRDAFCADQFAALLGADLVRLVSGERPDFQISIAGTEASYEVTEAVRQAGNAAKKSRNGDSAGYRASRLLKTFPTRIGLHPIRPT